MKKFYIVALSVLGLMSTSLSYSAEAYDDDSQVVLRVSGKLAHFNSKDGKSFEFTIKDLLAMKSYEVTATTPFAPTSIFKGPRITDILTKAGALDVAKEVNAKSHDGYQVKIPLTDFMKYQPVASIFRAGQRLTLETKGPVWIMYPIDAFPPGELTGPITESRVVWSLKELVVE